MLKAKKRTLENNLLLQRNYFFTPTATISNTSTVQLETEHISVFSAVPLTKEEEKAQIQQARKERARILAQKSRDKMKEKNRAQELKFKMLNIQISDLKKRFLYYQQPVAILPPPPALGYSQYLKKQQLLLQISKLSMRR